MLTKVALLFSLFIAVVFSLHAQLCTGSLGEAVVNVTFGSAIMPASKLTSAQSTYQYAGGPCPSPGTYSFTNLTFGCFGNSWQTLSGNHTPNDPSGHFLLINSESANGTVYSFSAKDLCPNTTYEFAVWVRNLMRPSACDGAAIDPNLQFSVENNAGTIMATYNSEKIPKEGTEWKQYGMLFTTGATNTDRTLKITNIAPDGCGNVFAIDDITVRPCGAKVEAFILPARQKSIVVCEGANSSYQLNGEFGSNSLTQSYKWQVKKEGIGWTDIPGANTKTFTIPPSPFGIYVYRMVISDIAGAFSKCSIYSDEVTINIRRAPFVQATNYVYGCLGGEVTLMASGAESFSWTGPNGFSSKENTPILKNLNYQSGGLYTVIGTTSAGCQNIDSTILKVYPNAVASSNEGTKICEGTSTSLMAAGGVRYRWTPSVGLSNDTIPNPKASPVENTLYTVKVTNQYGCSDTTAIKIDVWKKPVADGGPDLKTRLGLPLVLRGKASGTDVSSYWSLLNNVAISSGPEVKVNPTQTTRYTYNVTSRHGCGTSTDDVLVKVYERVTIPNAFSPNGDGINDVWNIEPLELFSEAVTQVYNRYGQMVHSSRGYNKPWDGTNNGNPIPVGTYFYIIDLRVKDEPKMTGSVTLLR